MRLSTFAATILYSVQVVVPVLASRHGFTTLDSFWKRDIATTLASKLSANASIVLPSDPDWSTVADRWTQYLAPSFSLVVEPATEADIVAAVDYAVAANMSFLTVSGTHGFNPSLAIVQNALMINLAASFDYIIIDTASGTALVGGGTNIGQFTNATFAAGRQVTVGTCWCVGVLGAGLGGGHGRLQGEAGLIIDNMIQLRVVLANGTVVNASEKENPDLFWGMRGAGQNFGVVVEANITTLPLVPGGTGYDVEMDFSPDQLEDVLYLANQQIAIQPPELSYYIFFGSDPVTLDLIFHINFVYVGSQADGRIWSAPWKKLGPIKFVEANFRWDELLYKSANGLIAAQCGKNGFKSTYSLNMAHFNVTTIRGLVTSYTDFVHANPSANQSILNLEVYSGHGVRAVPSNTTAYANRQFTNIMVAISSWYTDPSITNVVHKWCESARDSLQESAGYDSLHVYQNYAHNEPIQSYYGYEPWRLEKLMALKREYDPHGFFSGYAPIPLASG